MGLYINSNLLPVIIIATNVNTAGNENGSRTHNSDLITCHIDVMWTVNHGDPIPITYANKLIDIVNEA